MVGLEYWILVRGSGCIAVSLAKNLEEAEVVHGMFQKRRCKLRNVIAGGTAFV